MRRVGLLCVLLLSAATSAFGQSQPDFSGHWVLMRPETATADIARTLTIRQPVVRTTALSEPMPPAFLTITVERQFAADTRTDTHWIGTQGGVIGGAVGQGPVVPQTRFFVRWEDDRLVITTGNYSGPTPEAGPYTERTEVWQLDAAGTLTISLTTRGSGVEPGTTTATYSRN